MMAPNETLIYIHIPKTAGVTLNHVISHQFENDEYFNAHHYSPESGETIRVQELRGLPEQERAQIRYVHLHKAPFGIHEWFPQPCSYITVMRDPVDRVISDYYYRLNIDHIRHLLYDEAKSRYMTLEEFAETVPNVQARTISGIAADSLEYTGKLPNGIVSVAQKNIEEHFKLAGLFERFDESLYQLVRVLGWPNILCGKLNINRHPVKKDISKDTLKVIEKHNELDMELYEWVRQRFNNLVREQDSLFNLKYHIFHVRNKANQSIDKYCKSFTAVRYRCNLILNRSPIKPIIVPLRSPPTVKKS